MDKLKRINKAISETGYCSRRKADKYITDGKVKLNGILAVLGDKVSPDDEITVNGEKITQDNEWVYLAYNKPKGIVSTTDLREKKNILAAVNYQTRIFPIGRLDKDSEGLILLTNDGDIVNKILRAGNNHEKEYNVTVDKPITPNFLRKMKKDVPILGTKTKECTITQLEDRVFKIILTEGMNRQIRRMCEFFGYNVKKLKRVRIMNINLDIPIGKWRALSADEMNVINKQIQYSKKN